MKILITGSSGFIGKNLIQSFINDPSNHIVALSRTPLEINSKNYEHLFVDMAQANWTQHLQGPVDVIIHLAQSKRYRENHAAADDLARINILATIQLLQWAEKNQVKKFVFASSGNVYNTSSSPMSESYACEPNSMYAVSKLSGEHFVQQYSSVMQTIIFRIFGVYGPFQKNMIIPNIIEKMLTDQEITLAKNVGIYLTPLYIENCIEIIKTFSLSNTYESGIYNLAGDAITNLAEIVMHLETMLNIKAKTRYLTSEPMYLCANISKLLSTLNHYQFIPLEEGLSRTVKMLSKETYHAIN